MTDRPVSKARRALLGAATVGAYSAVNRSSGAATHRPAGESAVLRPEMQAVADRNALAAVRPSAIGEWVLMTEERRRGWFVARERNRHAEQIAADTCQAFYVVSTIDDAIVWVRDYTGAASLDWSGAKGDGVADDAPAINAMLQNPGARWFQAEDGRDHFLASSLRIKRGITLTGAGRAGTIFSVNAPIDVIDASLAAETERGLYLSGFAVRNRMVAGSAHAGCGVRLRLAHFAEISNIVAKDCFNGIHSTQSNLSNFRDIHIDGFVNAGILFDGGYNFDTRVANFTISGNEIGRYAIRLDDMCDEMIFIDGVCSTSRFALYTDASVNVVNQRPEFCRFARVSFDSCDDGLDLSHCADFVFDASFISCRPGHGAQIGVRGQTENIQFIGSTFFNGAKSAAIVGAHAIETDFQSCKFISNGVARANTHDTLLIQSGSGSFSVTGCRFRQGWDVASVPRYQIRIEPSGAGAYMISGNSFAAGGSGVLLDERKAPDRLVTGNVGA